MTFPFLIGVPFQRLPPVPKENKRIMRSIQLGVRPLARRAESRSPGKGLPGPLASRNPGKDLLRLFASRMERRSPEKGLPGLVAGVERPRGVWMMRSSLF
jgi:hypothetical protein